MQKRNIITQIRHDIINKISAILMSIELQNLNIETEANLEKPLLDIILILDLSMLLFEKSNIIVENIFKKIYPTEILELKEKYSSFNIQTNNYFPIILKLLILIKLISNQFPTFELISYNEIKIFNINKNILEIDNGFSNFFKEFYIGKVVKIEYINEDINLICKFY